MRILGVDTATSIASVALVQNGEIVAERFDPPPAPADSCTVIHSRSNHAASLLPLIRAVLDSAAFSLTDIDGFAVSLGPGSFTGLRIGLSTVKGLAYGSALPVAGIATLFATAHRVADRDGLVCALLDARKNEVYARLFYKRGGSLETLSEDFIAPAKAVCEKIRRLDAAACLFTGSGARLHRTLLANSFAGVAQFHLEETQPTLAATVACLGERRLERHEPDDPGSLVPLYLRAADAETKQVVF